MIDRIEALLNSNVNEEQAVKMAAYMKNRFKFAGIPKPELKKLIKPFLDETKKQPLDWELVFKLWDNEYREAQYVALEYIGRHHRELVPEDLDRLRKLIVNKSWWETVDTIDGFVGEIASKDVMLVWAKDENIWLRRVAIDFQQKYREETDEALLEEIICLNLGSDEFFINKAIGWSLREYGKVNPEWVMDFVRKYEDRMAPLSIKEATRNILKNEI